MTDFTTDLPENRPAGADMRAAFVGPKYDYYQCRWSAMASSGRKFSFNWAAFFLGFVWLAYRKMYFYSVCYVLFMAAEATAEIYFDASDLVSGVITLIYVMLTGGYANYVYKRRTDAVLASLTRLDPESALAAARRQGGTSLPAAIFAGVILPLALLAAVVGLYQAYPGLFESAGDAALAD